MKRNVYLENTPLEEAQKQFLHFFSGHVSPPENIKVMSAAGRVTAKPVFANLSAPHYHAAAMDGVAVFADKTFGATEKTPLRFVAGEEAFWTDTGEPLPPGTNAVIMVEDLHELPSGEIEITSAVSPWENVRILGEDMVQTELIVPANHHLRPVDLGAILAGGVVEIAVRRQPRIAIIPTGTELVLPGQVPGPGEIIEFNSTVFAAQIKEWGGEAIVLPITPDDYVLIKDRVIEAIGKTDIVLLGAGSSAGLQDFSSQIIAELGEVFVHGVATRPGKPVILGQIENKPVMGVPGYPGSAWLALELYLKPLLYQYLGLVAPDPPKTQAQLARTIVSPIGMEDFVRVKLGPVGDRLVATPLSRGAALTSTMVRADGILRIPAGSEGVLAGKEIKVQLLKPEREIKHTVVTIGSHDLVLDLIANLLREKYPDYTLSSAHVGSMGGLLALRRHEAHFAGTHLLDPQTGEYNISSIKKYIPGRKICLINLVHRQQGLMVLPDNPKQITKLEDLVRPDVVFINRQKGAGTRVLLDWALKEANIDSSRIKGYGREEYTHTSVAAAVSSEAADVGLGILSAARALGLGFIPWRSERYDLAIPMEYLHHPGVTAILDLIQSEQFKNQVISMGGYDVSDCGQVIWES